MSEVTPFVIFNAATPAAPSGTRNANWQTDGGTPVQNISANVADMVGDSGSGGEDGLVPAPPSGSAAAGKFLKADGTWAIPVGDGNASELQGVSISTTAPTSGQVLEYNGTEWAPTTGGGGSGNLVTGSGAPTGQPDLIQSYSAARSHGASAGNTNSFPSNVTAGDLLVVIAKQSGTLPVMTCTDNLGTPYTQAMATSVTSGAAINIAVFCGIAPSSGACTVTTNLNGSWLDVTLLEFTIAQASVDTSNSTYYTAGGGPVSLVLSSSQADLVVAYLATFSANDTFTVGNGLIMAVSSTGNPTNAAAWGIFNAGTFTITMIPSGTDNDHALVAVALKFTPAGTIGTDGDLYLQTDAARFWGPRAAGAYPILGVLTPG